jgi:hypothetical protein
LEDHADTVTYGDGIDVVGVNIGAVEGDRALDARAGVDRASD